MKIGGAALLAALACAAPAVWSNTAFVAPIPLGLDRHLPVPAGNHLTGGKIALGQRLFFDPILSADSTLACAGCHDPARAFTDGRQVSRGVQGRAGRRNVPTLVNRAYGKSFFWDGRTATLEEQVLQPVEDPIEMGASLDDVVARLTAHPEYRRLFRQAFNADPTANHLGDALASYVRMILSGGSAYDTLARGHGSGAPAEVRRGLALFRGKGRCIQCHIGPNLSDELFHNTGVAYRNGTLMDSGRYRISGLREDLGAFKTPTLREVGQTAPYMHDGSLATLEEVVRFYDAGGRLNPYQDPILHPLGLTVEERRALVTFLESLTGLAALGPPTAPR